MHRLSATHAVPLPSATEHAQVSLQGHHFLREKLNLQLSDPEQLGGKSKKRLWKAGENHCTGEGNGWVPVSVGEQMRPSATGGFPGFFGAGHVGDHSGTGVFGPIFLPSS